MLKTARRFEIEAVTASISNLRGVLSSDVDSVDISVISPLNNFFFGVKLFRVLVLLVTFDRVISPQRCHMIRHEPLVYLTHFQL